MRPELGMETSKCLVSWNRVRFYAISAVTGSAFQGEEGGRGVIRNKFYNCTGEEKDLFQCKRRFYRHCPSEGVASVVCSNASE